MYRKQLTYLNGFSKGNIFVLLFVCVYQICLTQPIQNGYNPKEKLNESILQQIEWVDKNYALKYEKANRLCQEQIYIAEQNKLFATQVKAMTILAKITYYNGGRDEAELLFKSALKLALKEGVDTKRLYFSLGVLSRLRGNYVEGLRYLFLGLEANGATKFDGLIYKEIGNVFDELELYDKSQQNFKMGIYTASLLPDKKYYYDIKKELGHLYIKHQREKEGVKILLEVLEHRHLLTGHVENIRLYLYLAEYYLNNNELNQAIGFINKIDSIQSIGVIVNNKPEKNALQSRVYIAKKEYEKAKECLLKTIKSADRISKAPVVNQAQKDLAFVYKELGQFEKSTQFYDAYIILSDSINSHLKVQSLLYLAEEFDSQVKDNMLKEQDLILAKQENKLLFFLGALILLVLIIVGLVYFYRQKRKFRQEEISRLRSRQKLIKLSAISEGEENEKIRLARELHDDVSGDLAAAKFYLIDLFEVLLPKISKKQVEEYLSRLDLISDKVRNISHNLIPPVVRKKSLVDAVIQMCQNWSSKHLQIHFQYFGNILKLDPVVETSVFRVIQELVTNALRHSQAKEVHVSFHYYDNYLNIIVEDDGVGFNIQQVKKGIGLKNIEARLKLVQGEMDIDSSASGTTIIVNVFF